MKALIIGLIIIAAAVTACLPVGLDWWDEVKIFLKGSLPVAAVLVGCLAVFIGIADIKDKAAAKKEQKNEP